MDSESPVDLDHLEKYVMGDSALRDEILSIFSDQAELLGGRFALDQSDEDWRDTAHALKGAARGVGAWALGDLCEVAEQLVGAVSGKHEKRAALLVSIRRRLSDTTAHARDLRGFAQPAQKTA